MVEKIRRVTPQTAVLLMKFGLDGSSWRQLRERFSASNRELLQWIRDAAQCLPISNKFRNTANKTIPGWNNRYLRDDCRMRPALLIANHILKTLHYADREAKDEARREEYFRLQAHWGSYPPERCEGEYGFWKRVGWVDADGKPLEYVPN